MTEEELQTFIQTNNTESQSLEYKIKPNFNDIQEAIKHITKRMHFNILKTIYAFANTKGGDLYIGIRENKKAKKMEAVGLNTEDVGLIKSIMGKVNPKVVKKTEFIELKTKDREVIKITVSELKLYDKPQLLDGILYYREGDQTKTLKNFENSPKIYQNQQFYLFLLEGIKNNFQEFQKKLSSEIKDDKSFTHDQFIKGLKSHINKFAIDNNIKDHDKIKKAKNLLDNIQKAINSKQSISIDDILKKPPENTKKLINNFIEIYKSIIDLEKV